MAKASSSTSVPRPNAMPTPAPPKKRRAPVFRPPLKPRTAPQPGGEGSQGVAKPDRSLARGSDENSPKRRRVGDSGFDSAEKGSGGSEGLGRLRSSPETPTKVRPAGRTSPLVGVRGSNQKEELGGSRQGVSGKSVPSSESIRHSTSTSAPDGHSKASMHTSPLAHPTNKSRVPTTAESTRGTASTRTAQLSLPNRLPVDSVPSNPQPVGDVQAEAEPETIKVSTASQKSSAKTNANDTDATCTADTWDDIPDATLASLENDSEFDTIKKVQLDATATILRLGEVRTIAQGPEDEVSRSQQEAVPWYGVIKAIRGLSSEKRSATAGPGGKPRTTYANVYVKVAFLYTAENFRKLEKGAQWRWKDGLKVMGIKERVECDHAMWVRQGRIGRTTVGCMRFDDRYPARRSADDNNSEQEEYAPARHPVTFIRPSAGQVLPDYFFGDEGHDGRAADGELSGAPFVRASFEIEAEPVRTEDAPVATAKQSNKATTSSNAARAKAKPAKRAKAVDFQSVILKFNEHFDGRAYNPAVVEHFSPHLQKWCAVKTLRSVAQKAKPGLERYTKDDAAPAAEQESAVLAALDSLAAQNIVRGGAYGLTGNGFLVTRAGEVKERLSEMRKGKAKANAACSSGPDARQELMDEAERLVVAAGKWADAVEARSGGGRAEGKPPVGKVWVCPSDGKTEI